jgi:hypothetical protein
MLRVVRKSFEQIFCITKFTWPTDLSKLAASVDETGVDATGVVETGIDDCFESAFAANVPGTYELVGTEKKFI